MRPGPEGPASPRERRALRLYRALLRLFPVAFRRARGAELESLFLTMYRERRGDGRRHRSGRLAFWAPLLWDTLSHAVRERLAGASPRRLAAADTASPARAEGATLVASLLSDVRHSLRSVRRQPLYAGLIVLMMTLGIAGNAAVFRIFNGLFLKPLAFDQPGELVDLDTRAPRWNLEYTGVAYGDFVAWREGNSTFQGMGVYSGRGANLRTDGAAERVSLVSATWDLPAVLGLEPLHGRFFDAAEDVPDGPSVALLTHAFWRTGFGADPAVVGRSIDLDGVPYEVVGVLPPEAERLAAADLWVPLGESPDAHHSYYLSGVGRLNPGATPTQAEADLGAIHRRLAEQWPVNEDTSPVVSSLRARYLGDFRLGSSVLLGAVAAVLLIACANIAGLMLARSLDRGREVAVRLAMGAGRARIVRQLLVESLTLAIIGAAVGTAVGVRGSALMVEGLADQFPPWVTFDLDGRFLVFTVLVTVGAAVLFGLFPALQTSHAEPAGALQGGSGRTTASRGSRRAMGALVVAEVALAFVLLVVAGVSLRDLEALRAVEPGFRTEGVLSYGLQLPGSAYAEEEEQRTFWEEHLERLRGLPGVTAATASSALPLAGHSGWFFEAEGTPPRAEDEPNPVVLLRAVAPGYMEAMDVHLLAGRDFDAFDGRDEGSRVAIVNETFVREFLGHLADPVGARIRPAGSDAPWWTVVGVNRDTRHYGLDEDMRPGLHVPLRQLGPNVANVAVVTDGDPSALAEPVRRVLAEQDPGLATFDVATMRERLDDSLWPRRASAWLIAAFSTAALLLAVSGIYGVISYTVRQRVREIGIRMALGAGRGEVAREVVAHGLRMVLGGALIGIVAAVLLAPLVAGALFRADPRDPLVYAGVAAVVLGVATLANLLPARRAARLDPMGVLRGE